MYSIKNSRGPSILPCGTPHWTVCGLEETPLTVTVCFRFPRYDLNQSVKSIPIASNLLHSMSWSTLHKQLKGGRGPPYSKNGVPNLEPSFQITISLVLIPTSLKLNIDLDISSLPNSNMKNLRSSKLRVKIKIQGRKNWKTLNMECL